MAPTVKLGQPSTEQIQQNPREAALYYQLLEKDSVTPKVNIREIIDDEAPMHVCMPQETGRVACLIDVGKPIAQQALLEHALHA